MHDFILITKNDVVTCPLTSSNVNQFYDEEENHAPTTNEGFISTNFSNTDNGGSRLNAIIPSTNSTTSQMGQQHQTSRPLLTFNGTGESSIVCPTNTLQDCLVYNQRHQRMFLNGRLNTNSPQTAYRQQGFYHQDMLDSQNPLVKSYRIARDCFQQNPDLDLKLRIIGTRRGDARTYNLPTTSEVAALIVDDIGDAVDKRDIIVTTQSGSLKRISELHPSYVPLQYPIFFLYGDDGYSIDILHRDLRGSAKSKRKKCTMREFLAYRFQDRPDTYSLILNGRRLTQQLFVDVYTMIETQSYLIHEYFYCVGVYTIEFQKRGLPHAHIFLFLHSDHKIHSPEYIDNFISAEIPDKNEDPELYSLVSDHMMHGPCGVSHPICSCMVDNSFSKNFPKKLQNETSIDSNGFPVYRIRDLGNVVVKSGGSIKYLFKYINKGPDRATISLVQNNAVTRLPFHLPGQQTVVFADDDDVEDVLNKPTIGSSRFTAWMECNKKCDIAQTLTYAEFPTKFVWKQQERVWALRKLGFSIGRIHHVPPSFNEAYYLRILLNKVRGPKCFEDIRTVDGEVCATYRDACYKRGFLDDDNECIEAIEEASHTASGYYLRSLFATMLITYSLSRPDDVWEKT
ncbi:uncharacterized protein LOC143558053 [Bidens hawaiensis]|uniref:uncharacterized protein LOC143558053 n=1 Tax=Bidens hawaiensis TaxID=980011 RepID=UPI004049EA8B